jgi:signal transduction histidine kinase
MILNRFGVRGRLNLLLLLPVIAVLLVATPLVVTQIDDARAAGRTADTAGQARDVGGLVWELQRELLVTSGYVASPAADSSTMLQQQRAVTDSVERVRASLGPTVSDELAGALTRVGSLNELRRNAVTRGVSLDSLARTYHAVTEAVIDALRLLPRGATGAAGSDAESTKALGELEALLRADEQSALRSTALITTSVNPVGGRKLLNDATANAQILTQRFVQQADIGHAALLVQVDQGDAGRKIEALSRQVPDVGGERAVTSSFVRDALAAAESQAGLRRAMQDQVTAEIADAAAARGAAARNVAIGVGVGVLALVGLVVLLSVIVSRSIADPLRHLTTSATAVADLTSTELTRVSDSEDADERMPQLAEVDVTPGGEVGELATAFNRVQATAAALLERQSTNRRNVSLMFANVARRTQNLVQRQLAEVDELERNEQNPTLLERLYRLDHLSTRLRRSADKLLVIAGSREQAMIGRPIDLATALRSALAEIEDYKRVRLGNLCPITLASPVASDLVLLFAELLENATASSPPDSVIEVSARIQNDNTCLVLIVDHGFGMTAEQLAEENRRLVERERLDIAPTGLLGLFVVGRLARRHSLTVRLVETPGGGITALVTLSPELFVGQVAAHSDVPPSAPNALTVATPEATPSAIPLVTIPPPRSPDDGFVWFDALDPAAAPSPAAPQAPVPVPAYSTSTAAVPRPAGHKPSPRHRQPVDAYPGEAGGGLPPLTSPEPAAPQPDVDDVEGPRHGLRRRVPGTHLSSTVSLPSRDSMPGHQPRPDPVAGWAALDEYQSAIVHAARPRNGREEVRRTASASGERRAGLTRRVPGASIADDLPLERSTGTVDIAEPGWGVRDAEADRRAFEGFAAGLARADESASAHEPAPEGDDGRPSKETAQ